LNQTRLNKLRKNDFVLKCSIALFKNCFLISFFLLNLLLQFHY